MKAIHDLAKFMNFILEISHPIKMILKRHEIKEAQTGKMTVIVGDSIVKNIGEWRHNKIMKSSVAVKLIPGAKTNGTNHHLKECLEDSSPD